MRFQLVKTVSYDLVAEVELEAKSAEEVIALLDTDGDLWIEWEQSDGNDEVTEVFMIEETK